MRLGKKLIFILGGCNCGLLDPIVGKLELASTLSSGEDYPFELLVSTPDWLLEKRSAV